MAFGVEELFGVLHQRTEGDDAILFVEVELGAGGAVVSRRCYCFDLFAVDVMSLAKRNEDIGAEVFGISHGNFVLWVFAEVGDVARDLRIGQGVDGVFVADAKRADA